MGFGVRGLKRRENIMRRVFESFCIKINTLNYQKGKIALNCYFQVKFTYENMSGEFTPFGIPPMCIQMSELSTHIMGVMRNIAELMLNRMRL